METWVQIPNTHIKVPAMMTYISKPTVRWEVGTGGKHPWGRRAASLAYLAKTYPVLKKKWKSLFQYPRLFLTSKHGLYIPVATTFLTHTHKQIVILIFTVQQIEREPVTILHYPHMLRPFWDAVLMDQVAIDLIRDQSYIVCLWERWSGWVADS